MFATKPLDWPAVRDSLISGIKATATPERTDRLFPGTPADIATLGGCRLDHGAAGVLHALHTVGASIPGHYIDWLAESTRRATDLGPGLFDGHHGVALTLAELGRLDEALRILARHRGDDVRGFDVYGGKAGVVLSLLRFADLTGDVSLVAKAAELAESLAVIARQGPPAAGRDVPAPYGVLHGTGADRYLDLAGQALRHDIDRCVKQPDGGICLDDGVRYSSYLYGGSGGLGVVLRDHLRRRDLPRGEETVAGIREACKPIYVRNSGLFRGRAGFIAALVAFGEPDDRPVIDEQVRYLAWDARLHEGKLVFPGFRMQRISMDLATGTAGCLLALDAASGGHAHLPFLPPPRRPT
jgi:hypothetical protein